MKQRRYSVTVLWGETEEQEDTYYFETANELSAFMDGIEEASGWLAHEFTKVVDTPDTVSNDEPEFYSELSKFKD